MNRALLAHSGWTAIRGFRHGAAAISSINTSRFPLPIARWITIARQRARIHVGVSDRCLVIFLPTLISDLDIIGAAQLIVKRHGADGAPSVD